MIGKLDPSAPAIPAEEISSAALAFELPHLVSESSATRAGYRLRYRLGGAASQGYVQEVETEVEFRVREGGQSFALVSYRGRYQELLFGGGLDLHSLEVWRERWDQRGIRALLGERLADPQPALELLRHGDPELVATKRFRLGLAEADPNLSPGYLAGAAPAQLTLYHPREPLTLEPPSYPRGPHQSAPVIAGPWEAEASEHFSYDFATCSAKFTTYAYRSTSEVTHG
jgi:hypothetical protein